VDTLLLEIAKCAHKVFDSPTQTPRVSLGSQRKSRPKAAPALRCDQYRDEPRTRSKQILDIFLNVPSGEINPSVTEEIKSRRKHNPGWKKIKEFNLKRYVAKQRKELGLDDPPASP
jgi:hypothetical protein